MKHVKSNIKKAMKQNLGAVHELINTPYIVQKEPDPILELTPLQISSLRDHFIDGKEISRIYFHDGGEFRKLLFIDYKEEGKTKTMLLC